MKFEGSVTVALQLVQNQQIKNQRTHDVRTHAKPERFLKNTTSFDVFSIKDYFLKLEKLSSVTV